MQSAELLTAERSSSVQLLNHVDIEEELRDDEHVHAISMCPEHKGLEPENGRIVVVLCGAIYRINWESKAEHCPKCRELFDSPKAGTCWVCGK